MKPRLWLFSIPLLAFSLATPLTFSQNQDTKKPDDSQTNSAPQADQDKPSDDVKAPDKVVQPADPSKVKHDGGKEDVDAVGNRNVGCNRGIGNWYSVEGQIRMGKQYAQQIESSTKIINDPLISEYVNRLGQNLVRNSDSQVPFTIK